MMYLKTPLGLLQGVVSKKGLRMLTWVADEKSKVASANNSIDCEILRSLKQQLNEYFKGERQRFSIPLDLHGTAFQCSVWNELLQVPFGHTVHYQSLAQRIARPKATRALANACAKNPLMIVVPCHRVLRADGKLGGYVGGLARKSFLLSNESSP